MQSGVLNWVLLGGCLAVSFLLSGMEAGVFALSRLRIRQQLRAGRAPARLLHGWLEHPENFLWTIFVGNTVVNFVVLGAIYAHLFEVFSQSRLLMVAMFIGVAFLFYILCDLLPKMLFQRFPNRLCLALAPPFRFVHIGLRPLVALVEWGSALLLRWTGGKVFKGQMFGNREEFRLMMQESAQGFTSEERIMINRVLDLQSLTLQSVTTPIALAVTVTAQTLMGELLAIGRERNLTRLPVWDLRDQRRRIVGLVDLDLLIYRDDIGPERMIGEFILPTVYLDENLRIEDGLQRMRRAGQMLAIVMRGDREVGIVSMQDILRKVFGEVAL